MTIREPSTVVNRGQTTRDDALDVRRPAGSRHTELVRLVSDAEHGCHQLCQQTTDLPLVIIRRVILTGNRVVTSST